MRCAVAKVARLHARLPATVHGSAAGNVMLLLPSSQHWDAPLAADRSPRPVGHLSLVRTCRPMSLLIYGAGLI